jgi:hypothetical protein
LGSRKTRHRTRRTRGTETRMSQSNNPVVGSETTGTIVSLKTKIVAKRWRGYTRFWRKSVEYGTFHRLAMTVHMTDGRTVWGYISNPVRDPAKLVDCPVKVGDTVTITSAIRQSESGTMWFPDHPSCRLYYATADCVAGRLG